jgi:hypothetical protein
MRRDYSAAGVGEYVGLLHDNTPQLLRPAATLLRTGGREMKWILVAVVLCVLFPVAGLSADYRSLTIADTASTLGIASMDNKYPSKVVCTLETAQIRIRMDGVNPTTTEGHILDIGQQITLSDPASINGFRAIRTGGNSGVLKCSYF